jgi:Transposase DDE domain
LHWPSYNRSLVRRGEILFSYDFLEVWDEELEKMNGNKEGKKYKFPDSFILIIGHIRVYFHLPYRQTEGIIKATVGKSIPTDKQPSYSQICRRVNRLDISCNRLGYDDDDDDESIVIAIDSTGIKVTNRGQWMQDKWNVGKKGYLKIHVAVNIKTKEILALEVTDEKVHDGKVMEQLVEQVLENNYDAQIKSLLGDGAYDSNENFKYLQKKKIRPGKVSRLERILSDHSKTISSEIEKLVLR